MKEHFVDLTDGTRLEIKVNFGTIYYLQKTKGFYPLMKKARKAQKKAKGPDSQKKLMTESESMELAADLIYAIIRSNGRAVSFDEALALTPPDTDAIKDVFEGFQTEYNKYAKKKQAKAMTIPNH